LQLNYFSTHLHYEKVIIKVFFQCSQTCGGGVKRRVVVCGDHLDENDPEHSVCDPRRRPADAVSCNTEPCPKWNFGGWGEVINY